MKFAFATKMASTLLAFSASVGIAQNYPEKPITLVMPYAAGGPGDVLTRIFAQPPAKTLGQPVVVDNTAGAGGTIGSNKVAKAKPDGYTLLMIHISHATSLALYKALPYHPINDFEPIGLVAEVPMAFIAKKDFPAKDAAEFVSYVKANGNKVTYGNAGIGSASHLCGLLFMSAIQTDLTTVPYKGTGPAMNDLMGGQFDMMCDQSANVTQPVRSGRVKGIAAAGKTKIPSLPELQLLGASSVPGFDLSITYGLYAPKGTPKAVLDKLNAALQDAVKDSGVRSKLGDLGVEPASVAQATPAALATQLKGEIDKLGPVIRKAGIYAD
jgi:tripartite-type tricarboxylate transporter receptor subunit TctC